MKPPAGMDRSNKSLALLRGIHPGLIEGLDERESAALLRLLGVSEFARDRIARDGSILASLHDLLDPTESDRARIMAECRAAAGVAPAADPAPLRRWVGKRRIRAILADIEDLVPFEAVMRELTLTAEAAIEVLLADLLKGLNKRFGIPEKNSGEPTGLSIIALGKCGGGDLNFSSDLDLLFIYGEEGRTSAGGGHSISNREFFINLASSLVRILSENTPDGTAYRVDTRLRPDGDSGPLAVSVASAVRYYEKAGAAWERQMLIKARTVAGDPEPGRLFLERVTPFIYRKYLDREAMTEIEEIKSRIEAAAREDPLNLKLGPGGIRDIEFIVQILQLSCGGRCPPVRLPGTIPAIKALAEHSYISPEEGQLLERSYLFLRRLEHRVQILDARQNHRIPAGGEELDDLASRMGYKRSADLMNDYNSRRKDIRDYFIRRFERSREISVSAMEEKVIELLDEGRDIEAVRSAALALGFHDPSIAVREMRRLARGSVSDAPTGAVRRLFIRASESIIPILSKVPDPDNALLKLSGIIERYGAKATLYEIFLSHPEVAELFVRVSGFSELLRSLLLEDPSLLEAMLAPDIIRGEIDVRERHAFLTVGAGDPLLAAELLRREAILSSGLRLLLGLTDPTAVGRILSAVADIAITAAAGDLPISVLSLGRLGSRNLGLRSDLDIVIIAGEGTPGSEGQKAGAEFISRIGSLTGFRVDPRLRPMGRSAPLVVSISRLESYLSTDAEIWERFAWTRARIVTSGSGEASALKEIIGGFLASPLPGDWKDRISDMRSRLAEESVIGEEDIKRGEGGLIDPEFIAAAVRILGGTESTDVTDLLLAGRDSGLIPGEAADTLAEGYIALGKFETACNLVLDSHWTGPPAGSGLKRLEAVLSTMGGRSPGDLPALRKSIAAAAREAWNSIR